VSRSLWPRVIKRYSPHWPTREKATVLPGQVSRCRLFFKQFLTSYHTTGAILPSGRSLCNALARFVRDGNKDARQILEVGPGTGSVSEYIVAAMGSADRLDLVELNDQFVRCLQDRLESDAVFRPVAGRCRLLHCPVQELRGDEPYDLIISGLPLNNFSVADVEEIVGVLTGLLRPGGTLSFFEYMAIRSIRALFSGHKQRIRLRGISQVLGTLLAKHEIRRDWIWWNVPPAWVHHVRR
jgi:phosphatidylethanolamine/phosphatidyl-N-methylethanolamine N-methyltransferase